LNRQHDLSNGVLCYAVLGCPYTLLQWFEELGGFEEASNIPIFVEWAVKAVELFGSRITFWATFNEPTVCIVCVS
jgi:beta-glucosidase/6-phospho-beta-glucosidase/beta-galactosidase